MKKFFLLTMMTLFAFSVFAQTEKATPAWMEKMGLRLPARGMQQKPTDLRCETRTNRTPNRTTHFSPAHALKNKIRSYANEEETIIMTQPEGELKAFTRKGTSYYSEDFIAYDKADYTAYMEMVYAPDGETVYFKDFVSAMAGVSCWVKGKLSDGGRKIHVPTGQNMLYLDDMACYMQLNRVVYNAQAKKFEKDEKATEITLSVINDKELAVDNTDEQHIVGLTFSTDNSWTCFGDYQTTYSLFEDTLITPPAGLKHQTFILQGKDAYGSELSQGITLMSDGKEAYLQGLGGIYAPEAWVKGQLEDNRLTIPSQQYLGLLDGFNLIYLLGGKLGENEDIITKDLVFTYDNAQKAYTTNDAAILANGKESADYYDIFTNLSLLQGPDISFSTEIINTQPEGEIRLFQRRGKGYAADRGIVFDTYQDGRVMEITFAPDNKTVYLKDPISSLYTQAWVKGTLEGNKITMPAFQCLIYDETEKSGFIMAKCDLTTVEDPSTGETYRTFEPDADYKTFTYTVDWEAGSITMDDADNESTICGIIMTDNFKWPGVGDYSTVYWDFKEKSKTMPKDVALEEWAFKYNNGLGDQSRLVHVGIKGNKVYIDHISEKNPEAVIEGTLQNGKVTFPSGQYLGIDLDIFMYYTAALCTKKVVEEGGYEELHYTALPALVFDYDEKQKVMTVPDNHTLLQYCGNDIPQDAELSNYYVQAIDPEFECYVERATQPADPTVLNYDDSYWDISGYGWVELNIPLEDTDGKYIKPEKMAYQLFIKLGEDIEPYTLYADEYECLDKDMDIVPYSFTDNSDIMPGGANIILRQTGFDDIGVQSINLSEGKEMRSRLVWFKGGVDAVDTVVQQGKQVKTVLYHSIDGRQLSQPKTGITLKTIYYTDGTKQTTKIIRK